MSGVKVLNFHEIVKNNDVSWFENIIIYLKDKRSIISCDDLYDYLKNDINIKDLYLLTVDDGHNSFYKNIYPIIKKHRVPIALFVSPKICIEQSNFWWEEIENCDEKLMKEIFSDILTVPVSILYQISLLSIIKSIRINLVKEAIVRYKKIKNIGNKPFQNLTVDNLIEMDKSGLVTIGAHTMNHPILLNEDDNVSKCEIDESIDELRKILGHKIKYFAYPNGIPKIDYSEREMNYVKSKGINIAFSTEFKKVSKSSNLMEVPRGEVINGRFNFKTKIYLWEYWQKLVKIKNGEKSHIERKKFSEILKNHISY